MRVQQGFVNVVATTLISLWYAGISQSQDSTTDRGVSPSIHNSSEYDPDVIIRVKDKHVNDKQNGYNYTNTGYTTDTRANKQHTTTVTTNTLNIDQTTTLASTLINLSTKSTLDPSMIPNKTMLSTTQKTNYDNENSNQKEQKVFENIPDGKSRVDKDASNIPTDLPYEAVTSADIREDTDDNSDDKTDTRPDTDTDHGDNTDMGEVDPYEIDEYKENQNDTVDVSRENQDTQNEDETAREDKSNGKNITTTETTYRDTNVTPTTSIPTHEYESPTLPHVSSHKHHVDHHGTKHVSGSHRAIPFRHHLQLVPMEDEPFGAVILKDERYVVSVMIPIGVGIIGAAIIIATLYTLRYIARKNAREIHFPPDIEHARPHSSCISSISSERTDRVVLLGGDEDDDF